MSETPSNNTLWIDLEKVDLPADVRTHTEDDITEMMKQFAENGQIQNIVVHRRGDRYEVVAGARRTKAAKRLGWQQIRADVRDSLPEYQRLDLMFSENEERSDANPLYQATLLKKMTSESGLTQTAFAEKRGKTSAWLSQYLSLLDLPQSVIDALTAVKISARAARAIRSLPTAEDQLMVTKEVQDGRLLPDDVSRRVTELLRVKVRPPTPPGSVPFGWRLTRERAGIRLQGLLNPKEKLKDFLSEACRQLVAADPKRFVSEAEGVIFLEDRPVVFSTEVLPRQNVLVRWTPVVHSQGYKLYYAYENKAGSFKLVNETLAFNCWFRLQLESKRSVIYLCAAAVFASGEGVRGPVATVSLTPN